MHTRKGGEARKRLKKESVILGKNRNGQSRAEVDWKAARLAKTSDSNTSAGVVRNQKRM